jgi:hypothetical protein
MGVALWAGGYYGFDAAAGGTVRLLVLAGLTGGGLAIYGLGLWVMGLGSPKAVMAALRRR